jgi:hypothetical protein
MTEREFCFEVLCEPLWLEKLNPSRFGDRPKLTSAFRKLIKRAGDDLDHLSAVVDIFAPPERTTGMFRPDPGPSIYFSPCLDKCSQAFVDYTVAHEFAHAIAYVTGAEQAAMECVCGAGDDCSCDDCKCKGCQNFELSIAPDAEKSREEYVNSRRSIWQMIWCCSGATSCPRGRPSCAPVNKERSACGTMAISWHCV